MKRNLFVFFSLITCGLLQPVWAQYSPNPTTEGAFAEAEYTALGTRPTPITVPHLTPNLALSEMGDSKHFGLTPGSSSTFHFVIAHRGSHTAPGCAENGACAIAAAYEAGADAIELDIKLTQDNAPVLGHDVTVARELDNWIPSYTPVMKERTIGPFTYFPLLDPTYLNNTKYPFLNDFSLPPGFENDTSTDNNNNYITIDSLNPPRTTLTLAEIQNGVLVDTYDKPTANHQLTLYEALYLIAKYYPMAVFLDVKSASDLTEVGSSIIAAEKQFPGSPALQEIAFKLSFATLTDPSVNGDPSEAIGQSSSKYFLVVGTGDLNKMATYGGQAAPTTPAQEASQAYQTIQTLCNQTTNNGCLGVELSHKYTGAPTQALYNEILGSQNTAIAAFQTVPQYSWYWQTLPSQKRQSITFGRTFPRTDGSCCFALTDALNASAVSGAEIGDVRNLYSWNEQNFSTITTDEPLITLRDLYQRGLRNTATASNLFPSSPNVQVPSGGASSDVGPIRDGLYLIQGPWNNATYGLFSTASGTVSALQTNSTSPTLAQMWYFSNKAGGLYTVTNAASGLNLNVTGDEVTEASSSTSPPGLFQLVTLVATNSLFTIQNDDDNMFLINPSSPTAAVIPAETGVQMPWSLVPVSTPSAESSQQPSGPNGYVYCADEGETCPFTGAASVAFGAVRPASPQFGVTFRYLNDTNGPVTCNTATFGGIDPAPGIIKACFYAPYDATAALSPEFIPVGYEGNTLSSGLTEWAFGAQASDGTWQMTYKHLNADLYQVPYTCGKKLFGYDPAPNLTKQCYIAASYANPIEPGPTSDFGFCAKTGESCPFSGTAVVAYGGNGAFTYKTFTNGVLCTTEAFGADLAPSAQNSCYMMPYTPLGSTTNSTLDGQYSALNQTTAYGYINNCGVEGSTCSVPQGSMVAFGVAEDGTYSNVFAVESGSFDCTVQTFGLDPYPGQVKSCYYQPASWANRGPAGFSYCAVGDTGQTCSFPGVAQIAYGADGQYIIKPNMQNGVSCAESSFGSDPKTGYQKACFYRLYQ